MLKSAQAGFLVLYLTVFCTTGFSYDFACSLELRCQVLYSCSFALWNAVTTCMVGNMSAAVCAKLCMQRSLLWSAVPT